MDFTRYVNLIITVCISGDICPMAEVKLRRGTGPLHTLLECKAVCLVSDVILGTYLCNVRPQAAQTRSVKKTKRICLGISITNKKKIFTRKSSQ